MQLGLGGQVTSGGGHHHQPTFGKRAAPRHDQHGRTQCAFCSSALACGCGGGPVVVVPLVQLAVRTVAQHLEGYSSLLMHYLPEGIRLMITREWFETRWPPGGGGMATIPAAFLAQKALPDLDLSRTCKANEILHSLRAEGSQVQRIHRLNLAHTNVTNNSLCLLRNIEIHSLVLDGCARLTEDGVISFLKEAQGLRELSVCWCPFVTNKLLVYVLENNLKLGAADDNVEFVFSTTPGGLEVIPQAPHQLALQRLDLTGCKMISKGMVDRLLRSQPRCHITTTKIDRPPVPLS